MRIRSCLAATILVAIAADDVPQEITCCFDPTEEGATRETVPLEKCPEEKRNPVDACNVGPGENEKPM